MNTEEMKAKLVEICEEHAKTDKALIDKLKAAIDCAEKADSEVQDKIDEVKRAAKVISGWCVGRNCAIKGCAFLDETTTRGTRCSFNQKNPDRWTMFQGVPDAPAIAPLQAARIVQEYCDHTRCSACVFYEANGDPCRLNLGVVPWRWELPQDK